MFELADVYSYCATHDVDVITTQSLPRSAFTVRDGGAYAVGLDVRQLKTVRSLRTAIMHESGHLRTGSLHKVDSPFQLVAQAEYKADVSSFQRYLPVSEIMSAMRAGYTEPWQLADYFDLEENCIKKALHYWTECRGVDFNDTEAPEDEKQDLGG